MKFSYRRIAKIKSKVRRGTSSFAERRLLDKAEVIRKARALAALRTAMVVVSARMGSYQIASIRAQVGVTASTKAIRIAQVAIDTASAIQKAMIFTG